MDKAVHQFKNAMAYVSEHYSEYVVIAKTKDGRTFWKSSDPFWAVGAMRRYECFLEDRDRFEESELDSNG